MRRVRVTAWQMVSFPNDDKGRRYWEESVRWRCDEMWRGIRHIVEGGLPQQHEVETSSSRQTKLLGTTFPEVLGRHLDSEAEGLQGF